MNNARAKCIYIDTINRILNPHFVDKSLLYKARGREVFPLWHDIILGINNDVI